MKTRRCSLWLLPVVLLAGGPEAGSRVRPGAANIALAARPSASYVSGDTSAGALNDGLDPRHSADRSRGSCGNWPRRDTQWVQYDWDQAVSSDGVDVYWWDDRRGVRLPAAARLLYWDGGGFVPVRAEQALGAAPDRYNTLRFAEVTTTRLRLEIDGSGTHSTGILEWRVYDSGRSPAFPPLVRAGADRAVVQGGRTYLEGAVTALYGGAAVRWRKDSGPGRVTWDDPERAVTAAAFSEPGDYALRLTASEGGLRSSDTLNVRVQEGPPAGGLDPVETMPYRITSPFWGPRARAVIVHWIPHCIGRINDPDLEEGGINNFLDAAGRLQGRAGGRHRGYAFSNAWVFNTVEAMCAALMVDPVGDGEILGAQRMIRDTLEDWIPTILAAQEPDGYLQTAFTLSDRKRWTDRHRGDHEGYVAGYYLEAAIAHYLQSGGRDLRLYDSAKRLADCWDAHIGPDPGKQKWYDGHQAMELALVRFGRFVNSVDGGGRASGGIGIDCGAVTACAALGLRGYTLAIAAACGPAAERLALSDAPPCPAPEDAVLHSQTAVAAMLEEILGASADSPEAVTGPSDARIVAEWTITGFEADPNSWAGRAGEVYLRARWTVQGYPGPILILAGELWRQGHAMPSRVRELLDFTDAADGRKEAEL